MHQHTILIKRAIRSNITIVANSIEKNNILVQIEATKRITFYHASSQCSMAGVVSIMHCCYTSKKTNRKKVTEFAIFTEQKEEVFTNKFLCRLSVYSLIRYQTNVLDKINIL